MSRDPSKSRPLSANVKRMMWLERAAPRSKNIMNAERSWSENDHIFCHKQGSLFMEAAAMGFSMDSFAPLYMTSQLAGVIDYSFAASNGTETVLSNLLSIPTLFKDPHTIVETLYWIEDILSNAKATDNKSLMIVQAYEADKRHIPKALLELPKTENSNVDDLSYAYWLGYIYRCECIMHDESSRMVYNAFTETIMRNAYQEVIKSPMRDQNISDCARDICTDLDKLLVEKIWPEKKHKTYKKYL